MLDEVTTLLRLSVGGDSRVPCQGCGYGAHPAPCLKGAAAGRQVQKTADHVTFCKALPVGLPQGAVNLAALQVPVCVAVRVVPHLIVRGRPSGWEINYEVTNAND